MATLNVKNFPDELYESLKRRARAARRSVSREVVEILAKAASEPDALSILDLSGLGRELFRDSNAAEHVDSERRSWG